MIRRGTAVLLSGGALLALVGCGSGQSAEQPGAQLGSDTHGEWSPDGAGIAYISNREGVGAGIPVNFEVYRAMQDGTGEKRLTVNQAFEAELSWSPDGSRLLYKSYRDGNDEIYEMDLSTGVERNITNSPTREGSPRWAPDGSAILFDSDRAEQGVLRLFLMDPDGTNVRPLPHDPGPGYSGDWSPDGSEIVFTSDRDGNSELYVMNADGSNVRRLTDDPKVNGYARWSPDGTTIAFTVGDFETDRWSVHLIDRNGEHERLLVDSTDSGNPAWSPDGTRILFGRYRVYGESGGDESRLYFYDLQTGAETAVGPSGRR